MEDTKHLEEPGDNLTQSKDKAVQYNLSKVKKYLEGVFLETSKSMPYLPYRMNDNLYKLVNR